MPKYSPYDIIKRMARRDAKAAGAKHSIMLERRAREFGFADNYEMTRVAARNPDDPRLLAGALGVASLKEVPELDPQFTELCIHVDDLMSGAIADTNAECFMLEDLEVHDTNYDQVTGRLTSQISFQYAGEQMDDRPWCGTAFYITDATLHLVWRDGWQLDDDAPLEILEMDTDQDRDYAQQRAEGLI